MDTLEIEELHEKETVAPPMGIAVAVKKGDNSTRAVEWALEQFMSQGETLILLHVRPRLLTIPTPMGNRVPISHVQEDVVAAYMQEVQLQTNAMFSPYQRLCYAKEVKTVLSVTEGNDVASALIQQISSYGIGKLVIGSSSSNAITRRFKSLDVSASLCCPSTLFFSRRFKPLEVSATVVKNAPNFCTVYTISKCNLGSVHSASSTEFKIGNPEDFSNHPSDFADTSNSRYPRTGGTESKSEASIQSCSQPLPFQRNQSLSSIHQVMRSHSIPNPVSTISNVESRSGSISMRSQTSCIDAVYDSGTRRPSMLRSEGYSEYFSIMSREERESPDKTGLPRTPALSIGFLPFMEIDTFSTSRNQFNLDTPSADGLSSTLQAGPAIFSDSLRGDHENVDVQNENRKPEMEISSWDFKTSTTSNNEPLSQGQNIMIEVERLKLELKHTLGMFAVAREEVMNAKITANELHVQRIQQVRKGEEAKIREYIAITIAAQEKAKSQMAMRQAETARKRRPNKQKMQN